MNESYSQQFISITNRDKKQRIELYCELNIAIYNIVMNKISTSYAIVKVLISSMYTKHHPKPFKVG